jgi:uncharacterized protein (TIGR03435 family)
MRFWICFAIAAAASAATPAAFDVASIKPAAISAVREGGNRSHIEYTPTRLAMSNVSVADCVQWAHGVAQFQLSAPHVSSDAYDILAKTAAPVDVAQLKLMLQDLLAKRFHLETHRETRMLPVYELVVAKGGPKLSPARTGDVHVAESLPRIRNDSFVFSGVTLPEFGRMLAQLRGIELPIVDRTDLPGTFDIALKGAPAAAREADTVTLIGILQEQTGLKLSSAKAPFEVVVIDHAERPSEN